MNNALKKVIKSWQGKNGCTRCPLSSQPGFHEYVFFRGSSPCDVLFIGEAPGKDEDMVGKPFVGAAGDILEKLIAQTAEELTCSSDIQLSFSDLFTYGIANIVACIPLGIDSKLRTPSKDEAKACSPRLQQMIVACNPRLIILLGREAEKYHKMPEGLAQVPVVPLQHPAYILRQGGVYSLAFDQNVLRLVDALEKYLYAPQEAQPSSKTNRKEDSKKYRRKSREEVRHQKPK